MCYTIDSRRHTWRYFLLFFITATMVISLSLTGTAVAEFQPLIEYYSEANDLDPVLVAAVILVESNGNPRALNPVSGAVGLMQIMPYEAGPPFLDRPGIDKLLGSETNISTGCEILAGLLDRNKIIYKSLYYYSGGNHWNSLNDYRKSYYNRVIETMEGLSNGRPEYQHAYLSPEFVYSNTKDTELPSSWFGY